MLATKIIQLILMNTSKSVGKSPPPPRLHLNQKKSDSSLAKLDSKLSNSTSKTNTLNSTSTRVEKSLIESKEEPKQPPRLHLNQKKSDSSLAQLDSKLSPPDNTAQTKKFDSSNYSELYCGATNESIQQNAIEFIPCGTQHQKMNQSNLWGPKITSVFEEDDFIVEKFGFKVDRKSLSDLISGSKINDLIVNFYIEMVCNSNPKVKCSRIDSLIVSKILNGNLTRLSKCFEKNFKDDFRLLFCPALILKDHWVLFVFDSSRKLITCYDSIFGTESEIIEKIRASLTKYITSLSGSDSWTIVNDSLYPKQKGNDKDCGIFVCAYSKWLAHVKPFSFKQNDIPKIRKTMGSEILKAQIKQFDCLEKYQL